MTKISAIDVVLFEKHLKERSSLSQSAIEQYMVHVRKFMTENYHYDNLEDYNTFITKHYMKNNSYNYVYALKKFCKFINEDKKLADEICKNLITKRLPERTKLSAKLSKEQILNVINDLKQNKHKLIARIQMVTGLRSIDIIRGFTDKSIQVVKNEDEEKILQCRIKTKGEKYKTIFIYDPILIDKILDRKILYSNRFEEFDKENSYLFIENTSERPKSLNTFYKLYRYNYFKYWEDLKNALEMNNIDKNSWATHDFRRNFANQFYKKNKDIYGLKRILDHSDINTTARYLKTEGSDVQDYYKEMQEITIVVIKPEIFKELFNIEVKENEEYSSYDFEQEALEKLKFKKAIKYKY